MHSHRRTTLLRIASCAAFALLLAGIAGADGRRRPTWKTLAKGATPRFAHTAVWESGGKRVLIFGGEVRRGKAFDFLSDTWAYTPAKDAWKKRDVVGSPPPPRAYHGAAWDPKSKVMWTFGGATYGMKLLDDLHRFDPHAGKWERLAPEGTAPAARMNAHLHYDAAGHQLLLYGGFKGFRVRTDAAFPELWRYDIAKNRWEILPGKAPGRWQCASAFNSKQRWLYVHGGFDGSYQVRNESWWYDLEKKKWKQWRKGPRATSAHTAVSDDRASRFLLFGGSVQGAAEGLSGTWAFNKRWSVLKVRGEAPGGHAYHAAAWDPDARIMYVFGGTRNLFNAANHGTQMLALDFAG